MKRLVCFFLFSVCCLLAVPATTSKLQQMSLTIQEELQSLKQKTEDWSNSLIAHEQELIESLEQAKTDLTLSESKRLELEKKSTELYSSLVNIVNSSNQYLMELNITKQKLETSRRLILTAGIILILMILTKFLILYLKSTKNITLPYWINCLL